LPPVLLKTGVLAHQIGAFGVALHSLAQDAVNGDLMRFLKNGNPLAQVFDRL
jgi:hypothetical protein